MFSKDRWVLAVAAAAALTLAAGCAGGSSTSSLVPAQDEPGSGTAATTRLTTTSAPSQRVASIESRESVTRGSARDPLANWEFLEPLAVTDSGAFSVPSWVTQCTPIDPVMHGLWYISWSNFSTPLAQLTLPYCTIPAASSSGVASAHRDSLPPSGGGNVYVVEIDLGFLSLTTTPIAGPALSQGDTSFVLASLESDLTFSKDHLYAFFLAEYTGTGEPTSQSI